jgi:hypothetical protein
MDGQIIGYTCKGECAKCPAKDAKDKEIERMKKQVAGREDEGYAGFIIGVEQMKKRLAEKDKEIEKLKAEFEELRYIVDEFREWFNENGCPKYFDPDFPCSAETEYKNDPETEGDFDERDCWKNEADHGCWVEYYRWKYRQKVGKDTNVPTNADTGKME